MSYTIIKVDNKEYYVLKPYISNSPIKSPIIRQPLSDNDGLIKHKSNTNDKLKSNKKTEPTNEFW